MTYRVEFSEDADNDLEDISDNRVRTSLIKRAFELREEPEKQGKPLTGDLTVFGSWVSVTGLSTAFGYSR